MIVYRYIPVPTGNSHRYNNRLIFICGISLYLQGTRNAGYSAKSIWRYIPVPTGNSKYSEKQNKKSPVYPCTYRELIHCWKCQVSRRGISLYLQGTHIWQCFEYDYSRYIPVPTGNSFNLASPFFCLTVYPCTYRELLVNNIFVHWLNCI